MKDKLVKIFLIVFYHIFCYSGKTAKFRFFSISVRGEIGPAADILRLSNCPFERRTGLERLCRGPPSSLGQLVHAEADGRSRRGNAHAAQARLRHLRKESFFWAGDTQL